MLSFPLRRFSRSSSLGLFISILPFVLPATVLAGSQSYTEPGTYSWTVPANVTSVTIAAMGGGGGGSGGTNEGAGGGGGGGGYSIITRPVTPGVAVPIVVGSGGGSGGVPHCESGASSWGGSGGATYFNNEVIAGGGQPGGTEGAGGAGGWGNIATGGTGGGPGRWSSRGGTGGSSYGPYGGPGGTGSEAGVYIEYNEDGQYTRMACDWWRAAMGMCSYTYAQPGVRYGGGGGGVHLMGTCDTNNPIFYSGPGASGMLALSWTEDPVSGTLTASSTVCTIAQGASSCSTTLSWNTVSPRGVSQITSNRPGANTTIFSDNTGSNRAVTVSGAYPHTAFYLYNNGVELAQTTVTPSCSPGSTWNGSLCAPNACANGAINPPSCTLCSASSVWNGSACVLTSGSCTNDANNPPSCTTCSPGMVWSGVVCVPESAPAPTVSFTGNGSPGSITVARGSRVNLVWSSTNASFCMASSNWNNDSPGSTPAHTPLGRASGRTDPITSDTIFTYTCFGNGSATASIIVHIDPGLTIPAPTASLTVSRDTINPGQSTVLTWGSTNADSCQSAGGFTTGGAQSGSVMVYPTTSPVSSYQITCTNEDSGISATAMKSIQLLTPSLSLSVSPTRVRSGSTARVTWSAAEVTSCSLTKSGTAGAWRTGLSGVNVETEPIMRQTTYTLTCQTLGSPVVKTAVVNISSIFSEF